MYVIWWAMMFCMYIDSQLTFYTHKDNLKHSSRSILLIIHGVQHYCASDHPTPSPSLCLVSPNIRCSAYGFNTNETFSSTLKQKEKQQGGWLVWSQPWQNSTPKKSYCKGTTNVKNLTLPLLSLLIHISSALFFGAKINHIYHHDFNVT